MNHDFALRATLAFALLGTAPARAADWRQFRGNETTAAAADDRALPTSWSDTENVAWKAALPGRGLSSPIVVGDRVIVTCSSGFRQNRLHVVCFAEKDGSLLWERQFWATGQTLSHPKTCVASSSPASDGERVFALYSSSDLVCLDLDGELQWYRGLSVDFPNASNSLGMASSPVFAGGTLVVQVENDSQSLALGIEPTTGVSRWTSERPKRANWTSPTVMRGDQSDDDVVLLQSSAGITAVNPLTGSVLWNYDNGASTIPSATVRGRTLYVPSHGITALEFPPGSANAEQLWRAERLNPGTASPLVYGDELFLLNNAGVLVCASLKDGEIKWQQRLEGPFSSSPVAAAGHLYFINETGVGQVVKLGGEKGEIVGRGEFGETILATPAVANGALYVRSDQHLWKLSK
jgi:outer membrane protein assembly factor BamB